MIFWGGFPLQYSRSQPRPQRGRHSGSKSKHAIRCFLARKKRIKRQQGQQKGSSQARNSIFLTTNYTNPHEYFFRQAEKLLHAIPIRANWLRRAKGLCYSWLHFCSQRTARTMLSHVVCVVVKYRTFVFAQA